MTIGARVDELDVKMNAVAGSPHASFEHIRYMQAACDLRQIALPR